MDVAPIFSFLFSDRVVWGGRLNFSTSICFSHSNGINYSLACSSFAALDFILNSLVLFYSLVLLQVSLCYRNGNASSFVFIYLLIYSFIHLL